ncbi:MAG: hypothetical protein QM572_14290 [Nocardioides sp.]|uniref:DUF6912 family protein n=1 Tax=Nocardioides sp. TaxID=35761 RepID=UPI0039E5FFEF
MTRLYVPATLELLEAWHADGAVPPAALEDAFEAPDESEDGEYAALMSAADVSTTLRGRGGRRVVIVLDGADGTRWAAVHADVADRGRDADPDDDLGWFAVQEIAQLR